MTLLTCGTDSVDLDGFAFGDGPILEQHVAECAVCQERLAEIWVEQPPSDLAEPVLRTLRFEEFLVEATTLAGGVVGAFAAAVMAYAGLTVEEESR